MVTIPWILVMARHWNLLDEPDNERKLHARATPSLGGIGIMLALFVSIMAIQGMEDYYKMGVIVLCTGVLTLVGIRDDLFHMKAQHKFLWQLAVAFIFAVLMSHWTYSLRGYFGVEQLPFAIGFGFSVLFLVFFTNAFNLIDGVDGLAGSLGVWICLAMGLVSYLAADRVFALLAFALAGSIVGFLRFNFAPARIFMGDTGSLTVGFMLAVFALRFMSRESYKLEEQLMPLYRHAPLVAFSFLIIPIYDTIRVILVRISHKKSPFEPGRDHIHHEMLNTGFQHTSVALYTLLVNIIISGCVVMMVYSNIHAHTIMFMLVILVSALLPTIGIKREVFRFVFNELLPALKGNILKNSGNSNLDSQTDQPKVVGFTNEPKVVGIQGESEKRLGRQ